MTPSWAVSASGQLYLSWVATSSEGINELQFAQYEGDSWSAPTQVARGDDWFINWADFSSMAVHDSGAMAAHFLKKSGASTYAYDVMVTRSDDAGKTWTQPVVAHSDGVQGEHGFVSWLPWENDTFFLAWLDGRNTTAGHGGAMTVRGGFMNTEGGLEGRSEIDARTCECCQTAATPVPNGLLVAYRDRSESEVRDIFLARYTDGAWSAPYPLHQDGWQIAGCPVNGPALDSQDDTVVVAWFTGAQGDLRVQTARSTDGGTTFSAPVRVEAEAPLGRVDVAMLSEDRSLVVWLDRTETGADIVGQVVSDTGERSPVQRFIQTSEQRRSGFPRIAVAGAHVYFAWTHLDDQGASQVQTARFAIAGL